MPSARLLHGILFALCLMCPALAGAAAGSSVLETGPVRLGVPGKVYHSPFEQPVASAAGSPSRLGRIGWEIDLPPGRAIQARLCQLRHCVRLQAVRGWTDAFDGRDAASGLVLELELVPPDRAPLLMRRARLLVNFR